MRSLPALFSTACLLLLGSLISKYGSDPQLMQGLAAPASNSFSDWHLTIDFSSNALFQWKFDRWIANLAWPLGTRLDDGLNGIFFQECFVFLLGTVLLVKRLTAERSWIACAADGVLLLLIPIFLFGRNLVLFGAFAWYPWLLLALLRLRTNGGSGLFDLLLLFFFSLRMAASANQLALPLILLALFWIRSGPNHSVKQWCAVLIVALPALFSLVSAPEPIYPEYPWLARVVPDDNLPGIPRPLIGPQAPLPVLDRDALRGGFAALSWVLICLSLVLLRVRRNHEDEPAFNQVMLPILAAALVIDSVLPEGISQIGPLAALPRILPGLFFFPLAPVIAALVVFYTFLFCIEQRRSALAFFIGMVFCFHSIWNGESRLRIGSTSQLNSDQAFRSYLALPDRAEPLRRAVFSPSYAILKRHGLGALDLSSRSENVRIIPGKDAALQFKGSNAESSVQRALDGKRDTRWSPKFGLQTGLEWIEIQLPAPQLLRGVVLDTGEFPSDFPRGLRLSFSADCSATDQRTLLAQFPDWQGPLLFTSEDAPYYGAQADVRVVFPSDISLCNLRIEQTGRTRHFDWSVAEIGLILPP